MAQRDAEKLKAENGGFWLGGCNTSLEPEALPSQPYPQYVWGINIDNSRGQISTRDGYDQLLEVPGGKPQMLAHFRSSGNFIDYCVMVVSGRIYVAPKPFTQWRDLGVELDANVSTVTFAIVERGAKRLPADAEGSKRELICPKRYIIIQDGVNTPVAWDGGGIVERPIDIPKGQWMAYVNNRLFVAVNDEIFWSDIADPFSFYDMGFLADGGQFRLRSRITGLTASPDGQALLAFETDACWRFLVSTPIKREADWKTATGFQTKILNGIGCLAGNSFVHHYGDLWWWSNKDLMSLRRALSINTEDEISDTDLEMTRSRELFNQVTDNVVGTSHLNYLLVSTPNNDIWVKNNSPASLLNTNTSPAWMGIWTGLRVKQFANFYVNGELYTLALSRDYDNKTRLWRLFNGKKTDNDSPIKWAWETKAHSFGSVTQPKRIRWADFTLQKIWGDVNIKAYYKGLRGNWKPILDKDIRAAQTINEDGIRQLQFRRAFTEEIGPEDGCQACGGESDDIDQIDLAFQLLVHGQGEFAIDSYRISAFLEPEYFSGKCEKNETTPKIVSACESIDFNYIPVYKSQTTSSQTLTFKEDICNQSSPNVSITRVSTITPPTPSDEQLIRYIQDAGCPCRATREYTSTQSYVASCVTGTGNPVKKTASATSSISQVDADTKALEQAKAEAEAELVCSWTATQSFTAVCPVPLVGESITKEATYTSTISLDDANAQALELAKIAAESELNCVENTAKYLIGSDQTDQHSSLRTIAADGSPAEGWLGSSGPSGNVFALDYAYTPNGFFAGGDFNNYTNVPSNGLVRLDSAGVKNPYLPNLFDDDATILGLAGDSSKLAIVGLFSKYNGISIAPNFIVIDPINGNVIPTPNFTSCNGIIRGVFANNLNGIGGYLIWGDFTKVNNQDRPYIAALNPDGSLDTTSFPLDTTSPARKYGPNAPIYSIDISNSGSVRVFVAGAFTEWNDSPNNGIVKLNGDDYIPQNFPYIGPRPTTGAIIRVISNKLLLAQGGNIYSTFIGNANPDPAFAQLTYNGKINDIKSDGSNILVLGSFTQLSSSRGAVSKNAIGAYCALLNSSGDVIDTFNVGNWWKAPCNVGILTI